MLPRSLADTTCGFGTFQDGTILCEATPEHLGRTTQVWDAVVTDEASGRQLALFRCTEMILWKL